MTLSVGVDIPGASFSGSAILVAAGTQRSFLSLLAELSIVSLDLRGHSRAEDREDAKSHGLCGAGGLSMYMRIKLTNALGEEEFNLTFEEGAQLLADQPTQGLALLKEGARLEVLLDDSSTWALVSIKTVEQKLVWGLPFPKTTVPLGTLEIGLRVFAEPDWSEVSLPHYSSISLFDNNGGLIERAKSSQLPSLTKTPLLRRALTALIRDKMATQGYAEQQAEIPATLITLLMLLSRAAADTKQEHESTRPIGG